MYNYLDSVLGVDDKGHHLVDDILPEDIQSEFENRLGGLKDSYDIFAEEVANTDVGMPIPDTGGFTKAFIDA